MAAHVRTVDVPDADRREVERARIVLLAAEGVPGKQIAATVGCVEPTSLPGAAATPNVAWAAWRTRPGRASRRNCPRSCGIGCWS